MSLRKCLREPIPEIEITAHRVSDAASAHLRGERDAARDLRRDHRSPPKSPGIPDQ
jgi:hypothetical protein